LAPALLLNPGCEATSTGLERMQNIPDILILARQTERTDNLIFLLRLSNYRTTCISDAVEAFNCLVQRQRVQHPVRLLLIDGPAQQQQFLSLIDELERCNAMLPILLIQQKNPVSLDPLQDQASLKKWIKSCRPEATHSCVRKLLLAQTLIPRTD